MCVNSCFYADPRMRFKTVSLNYSQAQTLMWGKCYIGGE